MNLKILSLQSWGEGLVELLCLLSVIHGESVEVLEGGKKKVQRFRSTGVRHEVKYKMHNIDY